MDIGLRLSWEQLEGTNVALSRSVEPLAGRGDDGGPGRYERSIDHDTHGWVITVVVVHKER